MSSSYINGKAGEAGEAGKGEWYEGVGASKLINLAVRRMLRLKDFV